VTLAWVTACFAAMGCVQAPRGAVAQTTPHPAAHVIVILMENHEYSSIIGSSRAPYVNGLARRSVLLTHDYAVRHPSLPNYLSLTGGSTFGITDDCTGCHVHSANLVDQLERHGLSWRAYMEGLPVPCAKVPFSGGYAKKHDPFLYYDDIRNSSKRCRNVVPLSRLTNDLSGGRLPRFAWVTPNLCHDMHDCSVRTGDRWLSTWVRKILPALQPDGLLVLTWDEGDTDAGCCSVAHGGHVATIIAGPGAGRGVRLSTRSDHYSILRLVEAAFGLDYLKKAASAPRITGYRR